MPLYNERGFIAPLRFSDISKSKEDFKEKFLKYVGEVSVKEENLDLLYDLMWMKYAKTETRYYESWSFYLAVGREMFMFFDNFVNQYKTLQRIRDMELEEIMVEGLNITNTVQAPNNPTVDAYKRPIDNTSTDQTTDYSTGNVLDAANRKYSALFKNITNSFYNKLDPLFTVFTMSDVSLFSDTII